MMVAALEPAVLHALAITGLAVAIAVPLVLALVRLPAGGAATLAALLLVAAWLSIPGLNGAPAEAAPLLPFVALPPAWGLRRLPAGTLRIAASLAGPVRVFGVWLRLAAPWLLTGLAWGLARALAAAGFAWPAALLLAAAAWPLLRGLAAREA